MIRPPCGLYIASDIANFDDLTNGLQVEPLMDDARERLVAIRITYMAARMMLCFDPDAAYGPSLLGDMAYRPSYLMFKNTKRANTIRLTWPPEQNGVERLVMTELNGPRYANRQFRQ